MFEFKLTSETDMGTVESVNDLEVKITKDSYAPGLWAGVENVTIIFWSEFGGRYFRKTLLPFGFGELKEVDLENRILKMKTLKSVFKDVKNFTPEPGDKIRIQFPPGAKL